MQPKSGSHSSKSCLGDQLEAMTWQPRRQSRVLSFSARSKKQSVWRAQGSGRPSNHSVSAKPETSRYLIEPRIQSDAATVSIVASDLRRPAFGTVQAGRNVPRFQRGQVHPPVGGVGPARSPLALGFFFAYWNNLNWLTFFQQSRRALGSQLSRTLAFGRRHSCQPEVGLLVRQLSQASALPKRLRRRPLEPPPPISQLRPTPRCKK